LPPRVLIGKSKSNNKMKLKIYEELKNEVLLCKKCDLGNNGLVDGYDPHVVCQGNLDAKLMFVAEAPGKQETIHKVPLTLPGTSGRVYEKVLKYLNLTRDDVFTSNLVLCRPPENRDPEIYEREICSQYLNRQIELVGPKLIVTFGRLAAERLLGRIKITIDHGKLRRSEFYDVDVFPLYHPAYISAYAPLDRRTEFNKDIKQLKEIAGKL